LKNSGRTRYLNTGADYAVAGTVAVGAVVWCIWEVYNGGVVGNVVGTTNTVTVLCDFLFTLVLILGAVYTFLRALRARTIVSDAGLVVQNWRKVRKLIPWSSITGVMWTVQPSDIREIHSLAVEAQHSEESPPRWIRIAYAPLWSWGTKQQYVRDMEELRDEIVTRSNLVEAAHEQKGTPHYITQAILRFMDADREKRVWRRPAVGRR